MPTGHYPHKHSPRPIQFVIGPSIAYVPLTQGKFAVIDSSSASAVSRFPWCYARGYAVSAHNGKRIFMHRFILEHDGIVDHKNQIGTHNWKGNLRKASKLQNNVYRARQINNSSGYKGVSLKKGYTDKKWRATIGKRTIGYYRTAEEAHEAYRDAAKLEFGEFAHFG
jgi:hypothetical protein